MKKLLYLISLVMIIGVLLVSCEFTSYSPEDDMIEAENATLPIQGKGVENAAFSISIDIKPGSDPNSINLNSKGVVPVAILTTTEFDATTVDHTTVTFEGPDESHIDKKTGQLRRHEEDVDGDGDKDLVFHFRISETNLTCDSTEGTLMGETFGGITIDGSDSINIMPGGGSKIYLEFETFIPGIMARPGYHGVRGLALSPDESLLYAAHWQAGIVKSNDPIGVYSTTDYSLLDQIDGGWCVGNVVTSNNNNNGRYVYAPDYYRGYINRYDTLNGNAKETIDLGSWAENVWKSPNGERIIVHYNSVSGEPGYQHWLALIGIKGDDFSKIASFNTGRPLAKQSAAFSDDGQHIYLAAGRSGTAGPTLIDVDINGSFVIHRQLVLTDASGQKMAGVARSGGRLFVGDRTGGKLHVVDEDTFEKIAEVPLSGIPSNIAIHPDQRHLFIMYDSGTLSIFDLCTMTEVFSLPGLNLGLLDAVFTADGRTVYVSHGDQTEGGFSVIAVHLP